VQVARSDSQDADRNSTVLRRGCAQPAMPYRDTEDGHRIALTEDIMDHVRDVFEKGFQLEAILLVHEYLEQQLNHLYSQANPSDSNSVHRKFKNSVDLLASTKLLSDEDYAVLNEFNRLRNINANLILNFSLTLKGAKKGDMIKAVNLAYESEQIIARLFNEVEKRKSNKKQRKKG
jgi:hypothetical protein